MNKNNDTALTKKDRINALIILSKKEKEKLVGAVAAPKIPRTIPAANSLPTDNHLKFLNIMAINNDNIVGVKNQIAYSINSVFIARITSTLTGEQGMKPFS